MRIDLSGNTALVTGAASGIGRAVAKALRGCGARVIGMDRDRRALAAQEGELDGIVTCDVTDDAAVTAAAAAVEHDHGAVSILVTAAGVLQRPLRPEQVPDTEWQRVIATNLDGSWRCARAFGAGMAARRNGAIVFVSSVLGRQPGPVHAYSAAKAGLDALTQSLAAEWGPAGVRVNAVAPGFVETPLLDKAVHFGALDPAQLSATSPLGRLASVEDVATAVAFLASPLAAAITGVSLPVDCGFLAGAGGRAFPPRGPKES